MSQSQALQQARLERHWTQQQVADQLGISWQTLTLWEQGSSFPDHVLRQRLSLLFGKTTQELGLAVQDTGRSVAVRWFVPLPRNPFFTGHEADLHSLHERFHLPSDEMSAHVQVICGAGGLGKTQVALEYAHRFRDDYATILWLRAETPETLLTDLITFMDLFGLSEKQKRDHQQILSTMRRWLRRQANWLLILDNIEELDLVRELLPSRCTGHVLLTTHQKVTDSFQHRLHLQTWSTEEGILFLLRRAKLLSNSAPLEFATDELRTQAESICQELGGLPLALDQVGAYMEETGCTLTEYQQRFQECQALSLSWRELESFAHPEQVATTILLAIEQIERQSPAAAELLRLCAFLAPEAIPEELLGGQSAETLGPVLHAAVTNPFERDSLRATFNATSLAELNVQARFLSIHRMIQTVILMHMDQETQQEWACRALLVVNQAFSNKTSLSWSDQLLPHAQLVLTWIERFLSPDQQSTIAPEISSLLFKVGNYLVTRGCYQKARPVLERCLALREQILGPKHPTVADSLARLGFLLRVQGEHANAEALFERALTIYEQAPLSTSPVPVRVLSNLAMLSLDQGQYQQAETFMKRLISIEEQLQSSENHVPTLLSDLATICLRQKRYEEARALLLHAVRLREQTLGPEHPDLLAILNNLAVFYWEQGRYAEAMPIYLRALHLSEQMQNSDASEVAILRLNLGELYRRQEQFEESEYHYLQALSLFEQTVGPEHPSTAHAHHGLALLRIGQGHYNEAEHSFHEAIQVWEQASDEPHADLAETIYDLAVLYFKQGKDELAQPLFERSLQIREQILGPLHPSIATSLHHLGLLSARQGRREQARSYYQRALDVREKVLGKRDPETQTTRNCLETLQANSK